MLDNEPKRRIETVTRLVTQILAKYNLREPVAAEAELAKLGMTSIDMVELMLTVEADFDVTIPPTEITLENFRSIAAVDRLVGKLSPSASGSAAAAA